ncbi:MAG: integrase, partial [Treponema sp.]|nr:integrase [Treponema sp.]
MDVVYVFFANENIRIPFYNYDKELFTQLIKSNMGHWDNSNQQFTISTSKYDKEKMINALSGKP